MASSLLQDAVMRHHAQHHERGRSRRSFSPSETSFDLNGDGPSIERTSPTVSDVDSAPSDDERERIPVRTVPSTPMVGSTAPSRAGSRATSPTRAAARAARRAEKEAAKLMVGVNGTKTRDPLRRLPNEVTLRIFEIFIREDKGDDGDRIRALLKTHRVCRRWRQSQTINYIWFHLFRHSSFVSTSEGPSDPNAIIEDISTATRYLDSFRLPDVTTQTWTRREAGTDWSRRYRSVYRRDDYQGSADWKEAEAGRSGYVTPQEAREEKWAGQAKEIEWIGQTKETQRAHYKSLANSKVKGKKARTTKDKSGNMDVDSGEANPWEAPW